MPDNTLYFTTLQADWKRWMHADTFPLWLQMVSSLGKGLHWIKGEITSPHGVLFNNIVNQFSGREERSYCISLPAFKLEKWRVPDGSLAVSCAWAVFLIPVLRNPQTTLLFQPFGQELGRSRNVDFLGPLRTGLRTRGSLLVLSDVFVFKRTCLSFWMDHWEMACLVFMGFMVSLLVQLRSTLHGHWFLMVMFILTGYLVTCFPGPRRDVRVELIPLDGPPTGL